MTRILVILLLIWLTDCTGPVKLTPALPAATIVPCSTDTDCENYIRRNYPPERWDELRWQFYV